MTGLAAAAGNEQAQAAPASAPPAMATSPRKCSRPTPRRVAARAAARAGAREKMEAHFGEDFSDVRVVPANQRVADAGAGAAAGQETVHFAPGKYDLATPGR